MDTSKEQSEPVLQSSVPGGGDISALTLYKVWARKEREGTGDISHLKKRCLGPPRCRPQTRERTDQRRSRAFAAPTADSL